MKGAKVQKQVALAYAFGSGLGHLTRTVALFRKLELLFPGELWIATNSPYWNLVGEGRIKVCFVETKDKTKEAVRETLQKLFFSLSPSLLVMDVFPFGMEGEMEDLVKRAPCKKVWIYRYAKGNSFQEHASFFDRVICPEDFWTDRVVIQQTEGVRKVPPILIRDPDELLSFEEGRKRLKCSKEAFLVLAVHTGKKESFFAFYRRIQSAIPSEKRNITVRFATPLADSIPEANQKGFFFYYPLIELFPSADLLIGGGGYNFFHEAKAIRIPALFLPEKRRFDDPFARTKNASVPTSLEDMRHFIWKMFSDDRTRERLVLYRNGAREAAEEIVSLLSSPEPSAKTGSP